MKNKVEEMREEITKIVNTNLDSPSGVNRQAFVRDLLEFAVLTRGEVLVQEREDVERLEAMKKKTGGW